MRGGMAYKIKPVGIFGGNDDQRRIAVDQKTCVDQPRGLAVERDAPAERDARQPRANRLRNVVDRHRLGEVTRGDVGQGNMRSGERRVGQECVRTWGLWVSAEA